jgi:hypothetical protein
MMVWVDRILIPNISRRTISMAIKGRTTQTDTAYESHIYYIVMAKTDCSEIYCILRRNGEWCFA